MIEPAAGNYRIFYGINDHAKTATMIGYSVLLVVSTSSDYYQQPISHLNPPVAGEQDL